MVARNGKGCSGLPGAARDIENMVRSGWSGDPAVCGDEAACDVDPAFMQAGIDFLHGEGE